MSESSFLMQHPDKRFPVAFVRLPAWKSLYVFVSTVERHTPWRAAWSYVPGANVLLVGDVDEALAGLITSHSNLELGEMFDGIHPQTLKAIRRHLNIAATGVEGRGGARPKAGAKKKGDDRLHRNLTGI